MKNKNYSINLVQTSNNINNPIMSKDLSDKSTNIIKLNDKINVKLFLKMILLI